MMDEKVIALWEQLVELGVATDEEFGLAVALCGPSIQTLEQVLYIRTGYRSIDQMLGEDE